MHIACITMRSFWLLGDTWFQTISQLQITVNLRNIVMACLVRSVVDETCHIYVESDLNHVQTWRMEVGSQTTYSGGNMDKYYVNSDGLTAACSIMKCKLLQKLTRETQHIHFLCVQPKITNSLLPVDSLASAVSKPPH